jgi:hypothetical protein
LPDAQIKTTPASGVPAPQIRRDNRKINPDDGIFICILKIILPLQIITYLPEKNKEDKAAALTRVQKPPFSYSAYRVIRPPAFLFAYCARISFQRRRIGFEKPDHCRAGRVCQLEGQQQGGIAFVIFQSR